MCTLIDVANYYCESWPAEYLLISTVPVGLTGGRGLCFMAMNRYFDVEQNILRIVFKGREKPNSVYELLIFNKDT